MTPLPLPSTSLIDFTQEYSDAYLQQTYGPDWHDAPIVQDYAEFSNQSVELVCRKMLHWQTHTKADYAVLGPDKFYADSHTYIYDILSSSPVLEMRANLVNKFIEDGIKMIRDHPGKEFLDFGAGIGVMCEIATALGKNATHVDVKSHHLDFARWRYQKRNLPINIIEIPEDDFTLPNAAYDIIFTDAVWEHLPPDRQLSYTAKLADGLKMGGLLLFLVDLSGHTIDMPMHYDVDLMQVLLGFQNAGLRLIQIPRGSHATVWARLPMGT